MLLVMLLLHNVFCILLLNAISFTANLQLKARQLVKMGIRMSTSRTYSSGQKRYFNFCNAYDLRPLPGDEDTLLLFVAYLHQDNLKAETIRVYLSAVRSLHIEEGYGNPLEKTHRLSRALRALHITAEKPNQKLPITLDIMELLSTKVQRTYDGCVIWAAMTLAFFGCLRASECCVTSSQFDPGVNLCLQDVTAHIEGQVPYMAVVIKRSKTDTLNKGVTVPIGCSGTVVCALCSMKAMLDMRLSQGVQCVGSDPLFLLSSGEALTKQVFVQDTRQCLSCLGFKSAEYSGHSFRAGSATSAALAGLADWELQVLGRWTSQAYLRYVRTPQKTLIGFARRLVQHKDACFPFRNAYITNVI